MYNKQDLVSYFTDLGIQKGDLVNAKISYKSIGKVEGGPKTVVEALLETVGEEGTIFSDSFVNPYNFLTLKFSPKKCLVDGVTKSYAGAIANVMINHPDALRSPHPIQKFVGIGKDSSLVLKHTEKSKPYSLLYELSQKGGKNLRIGPVEKVVGVGTTHCAIEELQLEQNILKSGVTYYDDQGELKVFYHSWPTSCKEAFNKLLPVHRGMGAFISEAKVGKADAVLSSMKKTFDIEVLMGGQFPTFLKCGDPSCYTCNLSWKDSSGSFTSVVLENLKRGRIKRVGKIIYMSMFKHYVPKKLN